MFVGSFVLHTLQIHLDYYVISFSLTISGIILTMRGRLCLRHFFANSCFALKVYSSFFIRVSCVCTLSLGISFQFCK